MEADVNQTKNLYNEYPEVVKEMAALLAEARKGVKSAAPRGGNAKKMKGWEKS